MEFDDSQQLNVRIVSTLSIGSFSSTQVRLCWLYCLPLTAAVLLIISVSVKSRMVYPSGTGLHSKKRPLNECCCFFCVTAAE